MKTRLTVLLASALLSTATLPAIAGTTADTATGSASASESVSSLLDLNRATQSELQQLPGVGVSKAKAIVDYRNDVGGFLEVEQLTEVRGIGDKMLAKIRPMVEIK